MMTKERILPLTGSAMLRTKRELYEEMLRRLQKEYPKGYVETAHLLRVLFGSQYKPEQKLFLAHKRPTFMLPWESPTIYATLEQLVASLHVYFSDEAFDKETFREAYAEWERYTSKSQPLSASTFNGV